MMAEITESEFRLFDILHHPGLFPEFVTPVDVKGTTVLPFRDWFENDHWGRTRLYQCMSLGWDHQLPQSVPIDSGGLKIDRASLGNSNEVGGRNTSKSFGLIHDELQDDVIRPGEQSGITSRDANHVTKRMDELWKYRLHPFFLPLIVRARRGDPYSIIDWWNGHESVGVYEGTTGEGDSYLGTHWQRINIDEFQLMSMDAWRKLFDAKSEDGVVIRMTGVSDGRRDTPAHEIRNSLEYAGHTHVKPQFLNELTWTPGNKKKAIEIYGGISTQGYITNVEAQEGEPVSGVWDLAALKACVLTVAADKHKPIESRRTVACPLLRLEGLDLKGRASNMNVNFPPDRDTMQVVWLSMDEGHRLHPTVIGIWGIDKHLVPHLWGIIIITHAETEDQAEFLKQVIEHYGVVRIGIDTSGEGGNKVAILLNQWRQKPTSLHIDRVGFSGSVEITGMGEPVPDEGAKKRRKRIKGEGDIQKWGIKYYSTMQLRRRIASKLITLLYLMDMFTEFGSEVAKRASGRFTTIPETYYGPQGDHIIDMMRVLEMMLFFFIQKGSNKHKRQMGKTVGHIGRL